MSAAFFFYGALQVEGERAPSTFIVRDEWIALGYVAYAYTQVEGASRFMPSGGGSMIEFKVVRLLALVFTGSSLLMGCAGSEPGGGGQPGRCDALQCAPGEHCELKEVVCVRAPCDPVPECVPDATSPFCGGIAGIPCPGGSTCTDVPNDGCDPDRGGADCGGVCRCLQTALCIRGFIFDSSPEVCECVPDPNLDICARVRCRAGTHCEPDRGCVPDEDASACAAVLCGPGTICKVQDGEASCVAVGS